ncbi:threonine dehydrogenase-like Zn-dependent dehydrogenase [Nitrospirillum amazonense]|uniref:Threonine dehydrogenase-like Zn-dependent dehydrogenase n=1 Tax=Nitrospirillum amazonense TaxID=28077 RepID=A0A560J3A5_9PROT|nr:zinc-dependent alcohol dehydrogenase [Nitrospirillum amazonense]TWB65733.1 threonine dehydrogenase-like Zn-dependent dehydrogenase [Nitrospirillum amazonense]
MKAVVFHDIGDIRLEEVPEPRIQDPTDAIIRITASAICGTDLHMVRGTFAGMRPGTILGHEAVGVVEELGPLVRNFDVGDRVVVVSTIACGSCAYCRAGYFAQCDVANPGGKRAGTAFFGGPGPSGPFHGLQAEKARIPYAHVGMIKLPDEVSDDQAILISDIFPTGWFGADIAEIEDGDTVAVLGCGPVGQFAIASAKLMNAGRVIAVDRREDRLAMARRQGAECVNFESEDPVQTILDLTGGIGVDRVIDAVGVDAEHAHDGPVASAARDQADQNLADVEKVAPVRHPKDGNWHPGDAPSQALQWAVEAVAKAGTIAIIGVYPPAMDRFPIGQAMNKNLTVNMGNCNHRRYVPHLVELVRTGAIDPSAVLTHVEPMTGVIEAYRAFDQRRSGWVKVELEPVK